MVLGVLPGQSKFGPHNERPSPSVRPTTPGTSVDREKGHYVVTVKSLWNGGLSRSGRDTGHGGGWNFRSECPGGRRMTGSCVWEKEVG